MDFAPPSIVRSTFKRENCKILIVDDDQNQSRLLRRPLEQAGYCVLEASTPNEVRRSMEADRPDLVLLDVMLGEHDGIELGRELKNDPRHKDTYVLFISGAKISSDQQALGLEAGAEGYLTRPVESRELIARVDSLARIRSAESELKNSEALWRTMFAASSDAMILSDEEGVIIYANPRSSRLYSRTEHELIGSSIYDHVVESDREHTERHVRDAIAGTPQRFEAEHISDGRVVRVEVSLSCFVFQGRIRLLSLIRDLDVRESQEHERLMLMHEVVFERERLNNIISSVPGVVWEGWGGPEGSEHRLNYVSDYVEYMLGYSINEWLSKPDFAVQILHPDDRERVIDELREAYSQADPAYQLASQYRWKKKDGNYIWVESLSRVVLDKESKSVGMRGVTVDITRRREAEENLRYQVDYNQAITQSMVEGLIVYDEQAKVVFMNTSAEKLIGSTVDLLVGKQLHDITHGQTMDHTVETCPLQAPLRERKPVVNHEEQFTRADGSSFPALCSSAPLFTRAQISGGVMVFRDISEIKQKEAEIRSLNADLERRVLQRTSQLQETNEQLELTNEQLETINRELEAFSYSVSHDLRAPFRHIVGFSELLEKRVGKQLDETANKYLKTISRSASYAGTLVDDLLNFSRIGRTELRQSPVDIGQIIDEIRLTLSQDLSERKIEWKIEAGLPVVRGDVTLLRLAFENLLSNAIKYTRKTPQARIEIGTQEDSGGFAVIYIRDNGVGFDMKYVGKLFGVFQRLHRTEEFEGTGIGLANVARIVQRHGGRVWAEAAVDRGATFFVRLPLA